MEEGLFHLQQTVQDVMDQHPKTRNAFKSLKTECNGCHLARFCSLQDVAEAYQIAPEVLLEELNKATTQS